MWSLAVCCMNEGTAACPFTLSAIYTFHRAQQSVVPSVQVGCMAATLFELPARLPPSHVTTTCPLASAATHGNTLDLPTVEPLLTRTGAVQVEPSLEDD